MYELPFFLISDLIHEVIMEILDMLAVLVAITSADNISSISDHLIGVLVF